MWLILKDAIINPDHIVSITKCDNGTHFAKLQTTTQLLYLDYNDWNELKAQFISQCLPEHTLFYPSISQLNKWGTTTDVEKNG
jgi:hypothetical protein